MTEHKHDPYVDLVTQIHESREYVLDSLANIVLGMYKLMGFPSPPAFIEEVMSRIEVTKLHEIVDKLDIDDEEKASLHELADHDDPHKRLEFLDKLRKAKGVNVEILEQEEPANAASDTPLPGHYL